MDDVRSCFVASEVVDLDVAVDPLAALLAVEELLFESGAV